MIMAVAGGASLPLPYTIDYGLQILAVIIARDFAAKKEASRKKEFDGTDKK
jgi:hypothetical protein